MMRRYGPLRQRFDQQSGSGMMRLNQLKKLEPGVKPFVVLIACYAVSNVLRLFLRDPVSYGIGFFSVMAISYVIPDEPKRSLAAWLMWSLMTGVSAFLSGPQRHVDGHRKQSDTRAQWDWCFHSQL
jgi:hypothetical protein